MIDFEIKGGHDHNFKICRHDLRKSMINWLQEIFTLFNMKMIIYKRMDLI